ncbi:MAG: hypothetical protein O3B87_03945 [bacterium]|nr:hypothetical protein [bacterium]
MKQTREKGQKQAKKTDSTRVKTCELSTEERLTVLANLLIDKLIDKYGTNFANTVQR